jgi:hypothetical protein
MIDRDAAVEERIDEEPYIGLRFTMKIMFLNEALLQMKVDRHHFLVFTDADTQEVNFLYREGEGQIVHLLPKKVKTPDKEGKFKVFVIDEASVAPDTKPRLLKKDKRVVGWMTPEEALDKLNSSGDRFSFFLDKTAQRAAVLYKQENGGYALIESKN